MKNIYSILIYIITLVGLLQPQVSFGGPIIVTKPKDPCTLVTHRSTLVEDTILFPDYAYSTGMDIYVEKTVKQRLPGNTPVVLIINGNGYQKESYSEMAKFLAHNGFVVGVAEREGLDSDPLFALNALNFLFGFHDVDNNSPIALIGHSKGGYVVNQAAFENVSHDLGFNIHSIINVAPNILDAQVGIPDISSLSEELNGIHTRSFLSIWGSRDQDMDGEDALPKEGIAAYDRVGTESSTTCGNPPCFINPQNLLEKISVYVHGANHGELIDTQTAVSSLISPFESYLSKENQSCIGKAYIKAFLRKHLYGEDDFDQFLSNEKWPPSFSAIVTQNDDDLGSPAGSPLRIGHQFSPVQKRVIENFEDQNYQLFGKSAHIVDFIIQENTNTGAPFFIRHLTDSLFVAWEEKNASQYIGFAVPNFAENIESFTHLSIRVGVLNGMPFPLYANGDNDQQIRIGLRDQDYVSLSHYHTINRPDTHTTMQTISVPLKSFNGIDFQNIQMIYLAFNPNTQGSLIVDNIEFIRD